MSDLVRFENAKVIPGGSTLTKRRGGAIGRPRTREPRKEIREALTPVEAQLIDAPRLSLVPSTADHAIPPLQRLSLARQIEIKYKQQQPRVTRAVIDRRDKLVHTENVLNWRVEIWQKGETRHTDKPLFFFRIECLILGARGGQNRRSKSEFTTALDCLKVARWKAKDREELWRGRGRYSSPLPVKKRRRHAFGYIPPTKTDTKLIEAITSCECPVSEALCPVCRKRITRTQYAVRSHLRPHVRNGLIQSNQAEEILSFLVVPKHQSVIAHYA